MFENRIHFIAVGVIDGADAVCLHFHGPGVGFRDKSQYVNVIERFPHSWHQGFDEGGIDIGAALIRSILRISEIPRPTKT
ncbi:MAG: hypothetical protein WCG66_02680 [bacterium]